MLAAASISYLGAFTNKYRNKLLHSWTESCKEFLIPISADYNLSNYLTEPVEVQNWMNHGIPCDQLSVENAIFVKYTKRWPYIIDPQGQAVRWICKMEKQNGLKVMKASDHNLMKSMESALRFGEPVLIEVSNRLQSYISFIGLHWIISML